MKERIELWKRMADAADPAADKYLEEITSQVKAEGKLDLMNEAIEYLIASANSHLDNIERSMEEYTIYQRLGNLAEVINLAYIARHYFGKTRQWLYQRIKGQTVNGKPATFTPDEKTKFLGALNDIGLQIASFTQHA